MHTNIAEDDAQIIHNAETQILNHCFAFVDTLVLRSAVELHIPDIIHSHGHPMTVSEIASKIVSATPPNIPSLARIMRVLASKDIFTINYNHEKEALYGLTITSKSLLNDSNNLSFAPMFLSLTHPTAMAPWHTLSHSIKEGGTPFERVYGETFWEKSSKESELNKFNSGMAYVTKNMMNALLKGYKDEFSKLGGTLVDVAGGFGDVVAEIVKAHPNIEGINFDLPHVVAAAPPVPGVTHVGGDMFSHIPQADTILLKSVLHNWGDEDCIKILKNIKKAIISKKRGKVILVEIILQTNRKERFEDAKMILDLFMMTIFGGGKERTEKEWKKLLIDAGFPQYNIIQIHSTVSIIEAFPE
ncbi:hypothetical protein RND81_11G099200 [Saponaria officinalis]|uniref:Uncharacterized protein n=1 Tax=Saponaria officinalis TaxID=3572 RepID=A0AAW1HLU6_SAPOF